MKSEMILASVNQHQEDLIEVSNFVWDHPETNYTEKQSSAHLMDYLKRQGFQIEKNCGGIPTAFSATVGSGKPIIAFLGEYDALPDLSQEANKTHKQPIIEGGNGHGCGHNLLGTGTAGAAIALKEYLATNQLEGTVIYYGCPAEEGGSGKTFMARAGVFEGGDVALTWHPAPVNATWTFPTLANIQADFQFTGKSSHAAASPHLGRSALDAVELMNVGANYLREHVPPGVRFHYATTDTGGTSPNVVQANAEVTYLIRAPQMQEVHSVYERIQAIAQGASLMTGTQVEVKFKKACSNFLPVSTLNQVIAEAMQVVGVPTYTEQELAQAIPGSTDVGDVSWSVPTGQCVMATCAVGTPFHSWQLW